MIQHDYNISLTNFHAEMRFLCEIMIKTSKLDSTQSNPELSRGNL